MIEPAPTTPLARHLARGTLLEIVPDSPTRPGHIVLRIPNTSYQLHLVPATGLATPVGARVIGTIHARAKRVDTTGTGGRFIEPVYGRPRRIQGFVVGTDPAANTITVDTGVPVICTLTDQRQHPSQFTEGQFVGFDVMDGATFEPQA